MKLFLCSHFSSVGSLIKEEIENKKVAFIPTASLREDYTGYVGSARKLFKKLGAIVTEIDISTEAYSTIQSVFEDSDVIYFTGGNSFFLMDWLRKTGTDGLLKKELANGKLMIGESAGAIICAPSIQSPYLFCDLNIFIVPRIIKSIFALNRKYNIGYHNDCNKNQPKNIKPFHIIYHHKLRFIYLHNLSKSSYNYYNDKLHNEGFLLNLYSTPNHPIF